MALATWTAGFAALAEVGAARALEAVRSPMVPSTGTLEGRGMVAGVNKTRRWNETGSDPRTVLDQTFRNHPLRGHRNSN